MSGIISGLLEACLTVFWFLAAIAIIALPFLWVTFLPTIGALWVLGWLS